MSARPYLVTRKTIEPLRQLKSNVVIKQPISSGRDFRHSQHPDTEYGVSNHLGEMGERIEFWGQKMGTWIGNETKAVSQ
jgi:hypothetical protein